MSKTLILGGQRSGKSRHGETIARQWLDSDPSHRAVMIATADAFDAEMRLRILRHKADRAERLPAMATVEEPLALAGAIARESEDGVVVVVDCLTLWLTNLLMPHSGTSVTDEGGAVGELIAALIAAPGPVVLVSNEIGLGVVPMGAPTRAFVDALGRLNQRVAAACSDVVLMVAGLPIAVKVSPCQV